MATPIPYTRGTSFTDAQAADPAAPLSGPGVDAEYDRILITINSIISSLADIQRADGALANWSVGADQIAPDIYTGLFPAVPWETGTEYALNRTVLVSGATIKLYRCLVAHDSLDFDDDLAAGYWLELADFTPPAVAGTIPVSQGGTGGITPAEARDNLGLGDVATEDVVPVAKGGTGSATASAARTALGLGIGTQVQAYSSVLDGFAGTALGADQMIYGTGGGAVALTGLTAFARTVLDDADAATMRATLSAMKGNFTEVTDWNDAFRDGVYRSQSGASNVPYAGVALYGFVVRFDDNNLAQIVMVPGNEDWYLRFRVAGTFGSWRLLPGPKLQDGTNGNPVDISGSRAHSTVYTNTGDRVRKVWISGTATSTAVLVEVNAGSGYVAVGRFNNTAQTNVSFEVPVGATYRVNGSISFSVWTEN